MTTTNEPDDTPRKRRFSARTGAARAYLILGIIATAAVATYVIYSRLTADLVSTDDAQVDADVTPVTTRVPGVVHRLEVEDNQAVTKGQLLVEIDPVDYEAQLRAAQAELEATQAQAEAADLQVEIVKSMSSGNLRSARARLQGSSASVRAAAAKVEAMTATVERAKTQLAKSESDLARAKRLHERNAITTVNLEASQLARDTAAATLAQEQAQLRAAGNQQQLARTMVGQAKGALEQSTPVDQRVAVATADAKLAHARAQSATARVELARLSLEHTKILAPVAGSISRLALREGQLVQAGSLVSMIVPADTYVIANFKETEVARIHPGDAAEVSVDAVGGTWPAEVVSISPGTGARFSLMPPNNATGNFVKVVQRVPVKLAWKAGAKHEEMRAGMSAEVEIRTK